MSPCAGTSRRAALSSALLLLAAACGSADPEARLELVYRLVEPGLREGARIEPAHLVTRDPAAFPSQTSPTARLPRAIIDDDTRHVLTSFESELLARPQPVGVGADGRLQAELSVGGAFPGAQAVVVTPRLRAAGEGAWREAPAALVPLTARPEGRVVALDVASGARAGAPVELNAACYRAGDAVTLYETAPLALPPGARLELSIGVLAPAAAQGPVRFSLELCEGEACTPAFAEVLDPATPAGSAWNERAVDLAAFGGATRSLRFRTEHLPGGGAFTLPVWGDPVVLAPAAVPDPRPNFVVLSIDTLRRDHLDAYGYFRETAPFLREQLGDEGVVFEGLVAEAATTDPSHMTMFTSLPALVHGVTHELEVLAAPVTTLAEAMRGARYRTAAFTEDGPLAHDRGFAIGFDAYRENKSQNVMLPAGRVEDTFRQARAWLDRNADRPFFLFLHTFQVHAPYEPPAAYRTLFTEDEPAERAPAQRRAIADYDREIRYVDDQLAELVRFAEQRGLGRNTIWVVLSDHGEEFWEHGSVGHGTLPYEEVLRVPLIVRGPGVARRERRTELLHHLDLMPTLLELAGVPVPPEARGHSFAASLRAAPGGSAAAPRTLVSAAWILPAPYQPPALAVRLGTDKLVRARDALGTRSFRFDLAADPRERKPLGDATPALRDALAAWESEVEAVRRQLAARAPGARPAPIRLDPEREQTLRALGYIE